MKKLILTLIIVILAILNIALFRDYYKKINVDNSSVNKLEMKS